MNTLLEMDTDYESKRRKKILDNGKNNVQSVYSSGPFVVLPRRSMNDLRMCKSPTTLLILGVLCSCANNFTGVCFPTYQYISNATNKSFKTISHAVNNLIDWGYIKRLRKGSPLYTNVKHKSSVYRILYDPLMNDKEVHSRALNSDPELQQLEKDKTLNKIKKQPKKTQTFSPEVNKDFNMRSTKTRLIELDSNTNTIYTNKDKQKMTEIEMMNEFKQIHKEVYKSDFIPDRRDWKHIEMLFNLPIPTNILLATIKRNLERRSEPPTFPLAWMLQVMSDDPETPQEIIKQVAKLLKRTKRNYD